MTNAFEYGDSLLQESNVKQGEEALNSPSPIESNQPYLNLATYVPIPSPILSSVVS